MARYIQQAQMHSSDWVSTHACYGDGMPFKQLLQSKLLSVLSDWILAQPEPMSVWLSQVFFLLVKECYTNIVSIVLKLATQHYVL